MTREQAHAALPDDARWTSSFGYPGKGGFVEYFRTPDGSRYLISNGPYDGTGHEWTVAKVQS